MSVQMNFLKKIIIKKKHILIFLKELQFLAFKKIKYDRKDKE